MNQFWNYLRIDLSILSLFENLTKNLPKFKINSLIIWEFKSVNSLIIWELRFTSDDIRYIKFIILIKLLNNKIKNILRSPLSPQNKKIKLKESHFFKIFWSWYSTFSLSEIRRASCGVQKSNQKIFKIRYWLFDWNILYLIYTAQQKNLIWCLTHLLHRRFRRASSTRKDAELLEAIVATKCWRQLSDQNALLEKEKCR